MMIRALDRKLFRDLWAVRSQAAAIALVIASGVALYILSLSAFDSLDETQRTYYERYRFADVFASLKRAPLRLHRDLERIPGVASLETRVVADVTLDVEGLAEPAVGRLISIPDRRRPMLNDLFLRSGRYIDPTGGDEVLAAESFALAHGLEPGDTVRAIINGRRRDLEIVGLALSPEYVYTIRPGELMPDATRFGVFWMGRKALANAFDMEGGFNDVALSLTADASGDEVIARIDRLLEPFGGLGAIPRSQQISHWYLDGELAQLRGMGAVVPILFLSVAAFLLNVVLSRMIALQREQIAALKALGYTNVTIAAHYVKWAIVVGAAGCVVGLAAGGWLGSAMTRMYARFFEFPILLYRLLPSTMIQAGWISMAAAVIGALGAVRQAVRLQPAEAMRPEPPAPYRESLLERVGLGRLVGQPTRMILRNLQRRPWRAGLSVVGIAFGGGMLIVGSFTFDAIAEIIDVQFAAAQRYDLMVTFVEPESSRAIHEVAHLPGTIDAEPFRFVPVRLRFGHRYRQAAIQGLPESSRLNRVIDAASDEVVRLPPDGLVLSRKLAELIAARAGDVITVEVLEGRRPVLSVPVAGLVEDYMGTSAYMRNDALHRLMREGPSVSGAYVQADESVLEATYRELKRTPSVAGVMLKRATIESFKKTIGENVGIVRTFNVLFAAIITFGVVYNAARISLSERSRELATLRVIGFTETEISYILLGELAVLTTLAIPLGLVLGYGLAGALSQSLDTELYRIPVIVSRPTMAWTALTVALSSLISGLVVRQRLNRLDLVSVLKTRE